jgi:hypothetical protein
VVTGFSLPCASLFFSSPKVIGHNDRDQKCTARAHNTKLLSSSPLLDSKKSRPSSSESKGKGERRERDQSSFMTCWIKNHLFLDAEYENDKGSKLLHTYTKSLRLSNVKQEGRG